MTMFKLATTIKSHLRLLLSGTAGSGKTYTALAIARLMAGPGGRVAVIDSERGSAAKYARRLKSVYGFEYDTCDLIETFGNTSPTSYITAMEAAAADGYAVVVVDSISHEWTGPGGALEMKDELAPSGNSFAGWKEVTPIHNRFVSTMLGAPCHVIACARAKTAYVVEQDERGRSRPREVGEQPIQREGVTFEFDVVLSLDSTPSGGSHATVTKTRYAEVAGAVYHNIGEQPNDEFVTAAIAFLAGEERRTISAPDQRPSPFLPALEWANATPRVTASNRATVGAAYQEWVRQFPEFVPAPASASPQAKIDRFRRWLSDHHGSFVTQPPPETTDMPVTETVMADAETTDLPV